MFKTLDEALATVERISEVRKGAKQFASVIWANCPSSADRTVALRLVHEAMMTGNKSIVLEPPFVREPSCPSHDSRCTAERCILEPVR